MFITLYFFLAHYENVINSLHIFAFNISLINTNLIIEHVDEVKGYY